MIDDAELVSDFVIESEERLGKIEALLLQLETAEGESTETVRDLYREFHTLKGNASFLGYVHVAALCHATETLLKSLDGGTTERIRVVGSHLLEVADAIGAWIADPDSAIGDSPAELLASLESLQHTSTEIESSSGNGADWPTSLPTEPNSDCSASKIASPIVSHPHLDANVYRISAIKALKTTGQSGDVWMVHQLGELAEVLSASGSGDRFAESVLNVFRGHDCYSKLDRVCLVGIVPGTKRLQVVDSACSSRVGNNLMMPGYACYPNPNGSLFKMRPGMVRVFDDSMAVIHSFQAQGRPVQRSIANIAAMGFSSGLCLSVGEQSKLIGFLFLNSVDKGIFRDIEKNFPSLLSVLSIYAKSALQSVGFGGEEFDPDNVGPFDANELRNKLNSSEDLSELPQAEIKLYCQDDFLFDLNKTASVLKRIFQVTGLFRRRNSIDVHIGRKNDQVQLRFAHGVPREDDTTLERLDRQVGLLARSSHLIGFNLSATAREIILSFEYDPIGMTGGEELYSVVNV
jgi:HPt (histidine-containing phosphotransfer) domain-containing protein